MSLALLPSASVLSPPVLSLFDPALGDAARAPIRHSCGAVEAVPVSLEAAGEINAFSKEVNRAAKRRLGGKKGGVDIPLGPGESRWHLRGRAYRPERRITWVSAAEMGRWLLQPRRREGHFVEVQMMEWGVLLMMGMERFAGTVVLTQTTPVPVRRIPLPPYVFLRIDIFDLVFRQLTGLPTGTRPIPPELAESNHLTSAAVAESVRLYAMEQYRLGLALAGGLWPVEDLWLVDGEGTTRQRLVRTDLGHVCPLGGFESAGDFTIYSGASFLYADADGRRPTPCFQIDFNNSCFSFSCRIPVTRSGNKIPNDYSGRFLHYWRRLYGESSRPREEDGLSGLALRRHVQQMMREMYARLWPDLKPPNVYPLAPGA